MQSRFAGDIGDFGKYGLLRVLARHPIRLGVIWYYNPDGCSGGDRITYLNQPGQYRPCDPELFDHLCTFSRSGDRSLSRIPSLGILPMDTIYFDHPVPPLPARNTWCRNALLSTESCDLVFLDPDTGLAPSSIPKSRVLSCHYVYPEEIISIRERGQSVLIYHHLSRRESAESQIQRWLTVLGEDASGLRFHRGGSRMFFFLPSPVHRPLLEERIRSFLTKSLWKEHFTRYPR
ncbi:MAG: hypothetical protein LUP99_00960 [Methanomicrobiales archaeon]|nr:hypothetical protein [Methanomicrobiales archaeon]